MVDKRRGAFCLCALDRKSLELGLARGMTLADARARIPDLAVIHADALADADFLLRLAAFCERYTPLVAQEAPDALALDVTGCSHLFGGEKPFRARVIADLARLGLSAHGVIAATPDAARALARMGHDGIVPAGRDEYFVRRLPLAALGVDDAIVHGLARAGLKTLGDLADRPSRVLAARFGEDLTARLARALGHDDIRITPLRPLPDCMAERRFPEPLMHADQLENVLAQLLGDVAVMLERNGQGGRLFDAHFFATDGSVRQLVVETGRPTREAKTILRLFHERMAALAEPLDPGFGFDVVRLSVGRSEALAPVQDDFSGNGHDESELDDLIDRLSTRLGRHRVLRMATRSTHHPVEAGAYWNANRGAAPAAPREKPEPGQPPARPLHMFEPPQPIEALAEVPDGPPLRFRWRRRLHAIARAEGPERIAPPWWRVNEDRLRDYYRIEDEDGRRFWVFRQGHFGDVAGAGQWFMHGLFA